MQLQNKDGVTMPKSINKLSFVSQRKPSYTVTLIFKLNNMVNKWIVAIIGFSFVLFSFRSKPEKNKIAYNKTAHTITLTSWDDNLQLIVDASQGCYIKELQVKGKNTLSPSGVYTGIQINDHLYTSRMPLVLPQIQVTDSTVTVSHIQYGDTKIKIDETWKFSVRKDGIAWQLSRNYSNSFNAEDMAFPKWNFANLSVWKGGIIDNGGMVWCKYLKSINDTYGVHTGGTVFWNEVSGNGLSIQAKALMGACIATKYSHSPSDEFTSTQLVTSQPLQQRYNLSRFVSEKSDVFAPFCVKKGIISAQFEISYINYYKKYSRGDLKSIDATAVRELLNTTARYGVVDNNIVGGNGWLTNWKCLHEPFFAQIALALDDSNYTKNLAGTLDRERDLAMLPDGRVLSRWHNEPGDEMPGTYNSSTGYYETKWGYTIDSQTGYVINVGDLFNINGNLKWLRTHQQSCERALNWLIQRDSNHNGLFEMVDKNIRQKKSSDWLDVVWAGFENAFVNAQMYGALIKWAGCEKLLGNPRAQARYDHIAAKLKSSFNKPVEQGGFWLAKKKQYIYWRDDDGSIHGDNLVTPVNFAAIAYGVCDDTNRIKLILTQIEKRNSAEKLFHWPLCYDSFKADEVAQSNWPFPNYENGDIFLTWGYLGIKAYVKFNKDLALKYVKNLLKQYKSDGLSFQRYSRLTGKGLGNDILSGNCTTITALYSDIYGIRPKWNRLVLMPHLPRSLDGTCFSYLLRDTLYHIQLSNNSYKIATSFYSVTSTNTFGISGKPGELYYYPGKQDSLSLHIKRKDHHPFLLKMQQWSHENISWTVKNSGAYTFRVHGLPKKKKYILSVNGSRKNMRSTKKGLLFFEEVLPENSVINLAEKK